MSGIPRRLARWQGCMLSVLRIAAGLLFLEHGTAKWLGFPHTASHTHLTLFSLAGMAGALELIGGALITLGLFTRGTAFVLSGEMAVAYFHAHAPRSVFPILSGGDAAALYSFVFLYLVFLVFAGPGPWSLDDRRRR